MPRPYKTRCIAHLPQVTVFKPAGVPAMQLKKTEIHLDELEAIRLVDGEGLNHAEAARRMKVSRPTVGRILKRVRAKISRALVQGEALFIEQGDAPISHASEAGKRQRTERSRAKKTPRGKGRTR